MTQSLIQPSFGGGEISPKLHGRVDTAKYRQGVAKLRNFFVHPSGGASNRPGTEFVGETADSNIRGRLIPFQFNGRVTYVLEFGDQVMRVIKDGGVVLNSGTLINNGSFDTNIAGWIDASTGAGANISWDSIGGRMKFIQPNGTVARARQQGFGYVVGATYTVTLTNAGITTVNIGRIAGANDIASYTLPAAPPKTFTFMAPATTVWIDMIQNYPGGGLTTSWLDTIDISGPTGPGQAYSISAPYFWQDLPLLKYTQSADVITFTHPNYPPQDLSRTGDAAWAFTPVSFAPQIAPPGSITVAPVTTGSTTYRYRVTAVTADDTEESLPGLANTSQTITGASAANPVQLTISGTTLVNGDEIQIGNVTGMTQLNGNRYIVANKQTNSVDLRNLDNTNLDGTGFSAYVSGGTAIPTFAKTTTAASLSSTNYIDIGWANQPGVVKFNIYREDSGIFGYIGSSNSQTFRDTFIKPDATDTPPTARNPFANNNWPSCVAYHDQRKFYANSLTQPQTLWASQTGNFKNMNVSTPTKDDDAITRTLVASQVNAIKHMVSMNVLVLFTSGAEWKCFPGSNNDALTPANCYTRPQSYNGCSDLPPLIANNSILFVQAKGSVVRDIAYEFASDSYTGTDRSVWSDHLFYGHQIVEWAYAQEPFRIIWAVREDGVLLGFTYMKEQDVYAWHRHDTDGFFESVAVISEDGEDVAYFIVRRQINGVTKRYVERLHSRQFADVSQAWFLDCALEYQGPATSIVTGLAHLEGKTVSILGDGNVFPSAMVSGGSVTLDNPASNIIIGLPYTSELETLDLDTGDPTIQGKRKKLSAVTVKLENSRGLKIGGVYEGGDYARLTEVKERSRQMYGTPIGLLTGVERVILDPTWNSNGRILIRQDNPLPCTILAAIPEVDLGN